MFALINKASLEYLLTKYEGMSPEAVREVIQRVALSEDVTLCKDCIHHREPGRCVLHSLGGTYNPTFFCAEGEPKKQVDAVTRSGEEAAKSVDTCGVFSH